MKKRIEFLLCDLLCAYVILCAYVVAYVILCASVSSFPSSHLPYPSSLSIISSLPILIHQKKKNDTLTYGGFLALQRSVHRSVPHQFWYQSEVWFRVSEQSSASSTPSALSSNSTKSSFLHSRETDGDLLSILF